jgi:CrcB protein
MGARLPSRAQLQTLLHLTAWCQIGVLLRIQLDLVFGAACREGQHDWVPCITSAVGALPNDLPPNAIGSFIMGLLASSDVLAKHLGHSLHANAPLAALPVASSLQARGARGRGARRPPRAARLARAAPLDPCACAACARPTRPLPLLPPQAHTSFQIGLRTGLCGSLTTFSSWMLQVVVMLVGAKPLERSRWVAGLTALALNVLVCMSALVVGQHTCLMIYDM